ncbi:MAG: hypothetical protein HZY76_01115 [Anaerolineae bacterium]|nr:MAG: hypothetical protein HZY76_01115 [Anaerolineae bacterium]
MADSGLVYALSLVVTVVLFNTLLAWAAAGLQRWLSLPSAVHYLLMALVGGFALLYSLNEIGLLNLPLPALAIQVPRSWATIGLYRGAAIYGAALGARASLLTCPSHPTTRCCCGTWPWPSPSTGPRWACCTGSRVLPVFGDEVHGAPINDLVDWKEKLYSRISVWHLLNALVLAFGGYVVTMAIQALV